MALNRKEAFLAAIAGEDVGELKPKNRQEAALDKIAKGAGGGGGGDMLSVAIVYDGSSYTCNKTYDEVNNALNNNIPIYAIYTEYNDNGRKLQCFYEEVRQGSMNEHILFIGNAYSENLHLYTNNEVHPEEKES